MQRFSIWVEHGSFQLSPLFQTFKAITAFVCHLFFISHFSVFRLIGVLVAFPLALFELPLASFGLPLAPCWFPLVLFVLPSAPFETPLAPFWFPFGSILGPFSIGSLLVAVGFI